jgi:hypothetical protein
LLDQQRRIIAGEKLRPFPGKLEEKKPEHFASVQIDRFPGPLIKIRQAQTDARFAESAAGLCQLAGVCGKDDLEEPHFMRRFQDRRCRPRREDLVHLLGDALSRTAENRFAQTANEAGHGKRDGEIEEAGIFHRANHAHGVLNEGKLGLHKGSEALLPDILVASDIIDELPVHGTIVEGIHRKVPALRILFHGAEVVV